MKKFSKLFALLLALALVLGSMTTVFAGNAMEPTLTTPNTTGKVTISNALAGATYKLYRVLDISGTTADGTKSSFVTNEKWDAIIRSLGNKWCTVEGTGAGGLVTPVADFTQADTAQQFAVEVLGKANSIDPDATANVETSGAYVFESLPYGYYVMVSSRQSADVRYTVFTLNKTELSITEKNVITPTIAKKVQHADSTPENAAPADAISADYNAILTYTVTITAVAGTDTYTITDALPGEITLVNDSLVVSKVSGDMTTTLGKGTDYTVTSTVANVSFEIALTSELRNGLKDGDKIVLTYNAKLQSAVATLNPIRNTATLHYGDKQQCSDYATVYTGHISFYKVDGKSNENLAGAKFVLKNKAGKYAVMTKAGNNYSFSHAVDSADEATVILTDGGTGVYTIRGLSAGEYMLVEVEAPANYIKGEDTTVTISEKRDQSTGVLLGLEVPASVTIVNMPGSTLPETGGTGTTIFYIAGAVLVVAALALLLIKRRTSSEN